MSNTRRILLMNPLKKEGFFADRIHMGLTLLGQMLVSEGHVVKVVDFAYLGSVKDKIEVPTLAELLEEFKPDVVGISAFTYLFDEVVSMIAEVHELSNATIIVGGPHATLFPQDFANDARVDYVVRGEAEGVILKLVSSAQRSSSTTVIDCPAVDGASIPVVNLDIAYGSEHLTNYQMQLSRGCPFNCSFCNVDLIAGRRVRPRDIDACLDQFEDARKKFPTIKVLSITDDCPSFSRKRFKEFLRNVIDRRIKVILTVDNMRADLLDEEMLELYEQAGGQNICLGVESGHPEVFKLVHKGESLDQIITAARLIKKQGLQLGMCFVIGLPEDSFERHKASMKLAKQLKPDYIYWNMCVPWPGTEIHDWFTRNGKIGEFRNFATLIDRELNYGIPPAYTDQFNQQQRTRAWLMANIETYNIPLFSLSNIHNLRSNISKLIRIAIKYNLYGSVAKMIWAFISHKLWFELKRYRIRHHHTQPKK